MRIEVLDVSCSPEVEGGVGYALVVDDVFVKVYQLKNNAILAKAAIEAFVLAFVSPQVVVDAALGFEDPFDSIEL